MSNSIMFDTNAAHIKLGDFFFAEVSSTDKQLESMGVSEGDIILCSHISNLEGSSRFNHQTMIWTTLDAAPNIFTFTFDMDDDSWMVYSGRPNGKGFIRRKWENKAKEFLGGNWIDNQEDLRLLTLQSSKAQPTESLS